jgi:hypothetical protein
MSKEEIEEWLEHIPVFAVTDSNGAGVLLRPENETSVFYFFMVSWTMIRTAENSASKVANVRISLPRIFAESFAGQCYLAAAKRIK